MSLRSAQQLGVLLLVGNFFTFFACRSKGHRGDGHALGSDGCINRLVAVHLVVCLMEFVCMFERARGGW